MSHQEPSILVKFYRDPLAGLSREDVFSLIKEKLKKRALAAYVFGSFAQGDMGSSSDIDIIIVCNTSLSFIGRPSEFKDLFDTGIQFDILVYTAQEWENIINEESVGFWKSVKEQMVKVF